MCWSKVFRLADHTVVTRQNWNRLVQIGLDRRHQTRVVYMGSTTRRENTHCSSLLLDVAKRRSLCQMRCRGYWLGDLVRAYSMYASCWVPLCKTLGAQRGAKTSKAFFWHQISKPRMVIPGMIFFYFKKGLLYRAMQKESNKKPVIKSRPGMMLITTKNLNTVAGWYPNCSMVLTTCCYGTDWIPWRIWSRRKTWMERTKIESEWKTEMITRMWKRCRCGDKKRRLSLQLLHLSLRRIHKSVRIKNIQHKWCLVKEQRSQGWSRTSGNLSIFCVSKMSAPSFLVNAMRM